MPIFWAPRRYAAMARRIPRTERAVLVLGRPFRRWSGFARNTVGVGDELRQVSNRVRGDGIGSIVQAGRIDQVVLAAPTSPLSSVVSMRGDLPDFTDRTDGLDQLFELVAADGESASTRAVTICAVEGMAGVGKTAFCVHAAHRLADRFPDGQLFLELHGHTPGQVPVSEAAALASLLLAVGVDPKLIPLSVDDRARLWRDRIAHRKMLVVLDDAAEERQVRPLLPGAPGSLTLITSRRRLAGLDGLRLLNLDVLPQADAVQMLLRVSGRRTDSADEDTALVEIVQRCGCLPLAIAMVAAQLRRHPTWDAGYLADRLAEAHDGLEHLRAGDRSVRAAFEMSFEHLPSDRRTVFCLLGVFPGAEFDAHALAALTDSTVVVARENAEALYEANLLQETTPGRYRLHDLLRAYACSLAAGIDADDRRKAVHRVLNYYLRAATTASARLPSHRPPNLPEVDTAPTALPRLDTIAEACQWLSAELATLTACQDFAATGPDKWWAVHLAAVLQPYFRRFNGDWEQALHVTRTALTAATETNDRLGRASTLNDLGRVYWRRSEYSQAVDAFTEALELYVDLGDRSGQASALVGLGGQQLSRDDYASAAERLVLAYELYLDLGNRVGQADTLSMLGRVHHYRGEYARSVEAVVEAYDLYTGVGDRLGQATTLEQIGAERCMQGEYQAAVDALTQAYDFSVGLGDRWAQGNALANLGIAYRLWDKPEAAIEKLTGAYELYTELGFQMGRANALTNLGCLYHQRAAPAQALDVLTRAYDLFVQVHDRDGEAETLNNFGDLALDHPDAGDPRTHFRAALTIARDIGTVRHEAHALHGLARCLLQDGDTGQARTLLHEAHAIYQNLDSPEADHVRTTLAMLNAPTSPPSEEPR